jgi:hypothetical protein
MVEVILLAQLVRRPLQAMARRWYCHSLFHATRGARRSLPGVHGFVKEA